MTLATATATVDERSGWRHPLGLPLWAMTAPALGLVAVLTSLGNAGPVGVTVAAIVLIACVIAAVHHAEVVAHRVGEPFGTLVLAIAVTVISSQPSSL